MVERLKSTIWGDKLTADWPKAPLRTPVRCAIYTRQSVEAHDNLSSCQVQFDVCRSFVQAHRGLGYELIEERLDDEGCSGATLERPALQRLLSLVRSGGVDRVVVHRLGLVVDGYRFRDGCHHGLVERSVYHAVQNLLTFRRSRTPGRTTPPLPWPLLGLVSCGRCGRPMSTHTIRRGSVIYRYYRCRSTAAGREPCKERW